MRVPPCLLVRHKYRHTNHHAAASLSFKFVPAPLGVAHDTNATRPTARTTPPPSFPSHTRRTRGTGRAGAYEAGFVFGSSSSRRRRRGPWAVLELPEIQQPPENEARLPATRPIVIKKVRRLGFLVCVWWPFPLRCDRRPARWPVGAGIFLVWGFSVRPSARLLITDFSLGVSGRTFE